MSANKQIQEMMQSWAEAQQTLWSEWLDALRSGSHGSELWSKTIDQWEASVKRTLETQKESMRVWAEGLKEAEGAPEEVRRRADEGVDMVGRLVDAQGQLWDQWFALARRAARSTPTGGGPEGMMKAWQDAARQMIDTQARWVETVKPTAPGAPGKKK